MDSGSVVRKDTWTTRERGGEGVRSHVMFHHEKEHAVPFLKCFHYRPVVGRWFGKHQVVLS